MGRCVGGIVDGLYFFLLPLLTEYPVRDKIDDNAA